MSVAVKEEPSVSTEDYKGEERDIMQLTGLLRDEAAVRAVLHGLRGRDRGTVEEVLTTLVDPKGNERDIMQVNEKSSELAPDLYRALNHLAGNRSTYLASLVRLARNRYDWRKLLIPSGF